MNRKKLTRRFQKKVSVARFFIHSYLCFLVPLLPTFLSQMATSFVHSDDLDAFITNYEVFPLAHFWMRDTNVTVLWWPLWHSVIFRRDDAGDGTSYAAGSVYPSNILHTLANYLGYGSDIMFSVSDLHVYTISYPDGANYGEEVAEETAPPSNFHDMTWNDFVFSDRRFSCDVRVLTNEEAEAMVAGGGVGAGAGAAAGVADSAVLAGDGGGLYSNSEVREVDELRVLNADEFAAAVADSIAYAAAEAVVDGVV